MLLFLLSLLATVLIEVPLLFVLTRFVKPNRPSPGKIIRAGLLASITTLPYLWCVFPEVFSVWGYYLAEAAIAWFEGEIFVFTLGLPRVRAIGYALLCNLASVAATPAVGRILDALGVTPY